MRSSSSPRTCGDEAYDWVLLDCPPSLGVLTVAALTAADGVLIPLQCETLSHRGVGQLLDTVHDVRRFTNRGLEVWGVLPTLYDGRTNHARTVLETISETYDLEVIEPPIPKTIKFAEAPAAGRSILSTSRSSKGAQAYRAVAENLVERAPPARRRRRARQEAGPRRPPPRRRRPARDQPWASLTGEPPRVRLRLRLRRRGASPAAFSRVPPSREPRGSRHGSHRHGSRRRASRARGPGAPSSPPAPGGTMRPLVPAGMPWSWKRCSEVE